MSYHRYTLSPPPQAGQAPKPLDISIPIHPGNGDSLLEAQLLYVTTSRYGRDWNCTTHSHPFMELFLVTDGSGRFLAQGESLPLRKNNLVIINPYVEHTEKSQLDEPLEYIVLGISGLEFLRTRLEGSSNVLYIPDCDANVGRYIRDLLREAQHPGFGHTDLCQYLLMAVLILLLRLDIMNISITASRDVQAFCSVVRSYIDAHCKEPLTLDTLADVVRLNKFYMVHAFTKAYGLSPMKYLMMRKIEESKYLLTETDTSVADIAANIGFCSASHFSKHFKQSTGFTPNAYRKQAKQDS